MTSIGRNVNPITSPQLVDRCFFLEIRMKLYMRVTNGEEPFNIFLLDDGTVIGVKQMRLFAL